MKKAALLMLAVLLLLPMLATAATNMQVNSSAVPVSGGTISPNGIKFYAYSSASLTPTHGGVATYTATPKTGWTLKNVVIDGVVATAPYQVPFDTSKVHTVKANFAQTLYSITSTVLPGGGGTIQVTGGGSTNITPGSTRGIVVAPSTGYKITSLTATGVVLPPLGDPTAPYILSIPNIQGNITVTAGFSVNPAANLVVYAGPNQTVGLTIPGFAQKVATLVGQTSVAAAPYNFNVVSGACTVGAPTSVVVDPVTGKATITADLSAGATGSCGVTLTASGVTSPLPATTITIVNPGVVNAGSTACNTCHAGSPQQVAYGTSVHAVFNAPCNGCHAGAAHPGVLQCDTCHSTGPNPPQSFLNMCLACHQNPDIHAMQAGTGIQIVFDGCTPCHGGGAAHKPLVANGCVGCHSIPINNNHGGGVSDNNSGVRAVTQEFTKWSHHVTGVTLNNAHCTACHLEGTVVNGVVQVDVSKHIVGNVTHLRNADTDADMQWDPANPDHSTMDNFCMSCHDANGATSPISQAVQSFINEKGLAAPGKIASATNPFGDTISNRYDKMFRPAVVNVDSQFNTTNNSHHGVKGPRYSGRTRAAGPRQIASPGTFAANSSATLWGKRSTIYDSVNATTGVSEFTTNPAFTSLYTPLANATGEAYPRTGSATLGDDSTLHCGDCHTVGQWKPNAAKNADGTNAPAVIGAHGSNNEYMLRNDKGIDERHTQEAYVVSLGVVIYSTPNAARLICYNCHSFKRYGSVYSATGAAGPHAGEYDSSGRCNGVGNTIPFNGYTTGTATDGTQFESRIGEGTLAQLSSTPAFAPGFPLNYANAPGGAQAATYVGEQPADFGNVFGIQCLNCHNSGIGNGYGGIHGSANNSPGTDNTAKVGGYANPDPAVTGGAYVDGMGNTNKNQRFLPGLGNIMHVPGTLGGFVGGKTASTWAGTATNPGITFDFTTGAISKDSNWEQVGWKQIPGNATGAAVSSAGCYTLNNEITPGDPLNDPNSASYGIKGQSFDGGATIPNASKTWGGCDDHTGTSVGSADHGFVKRINRPVTY